MLLQTSEATEARSLTILGVAVTMVFLVVSALFLVNPFTNDGDSRIAIAIDTPYVVQGIAQKTPLTLHGVNVGEVTAISRLPEGNVRLHIDLKKAQVAGLTDAMQIDFRPAGYFGVPAINIRTGNGGRMLRNGIRISTVPEGDYTLQAVLSRLGQLSTAVITPQLVNVIDRATRYTDALNPLVETIMIAANSLAQVQTVPTAQLLVNATGVSVATPALTDAAISAIENLARADMNYLHKGFGDETEEEWSKVFGIPIFELIGKGVFRTAGTLEGTHVADLYPLINGLQSISDTVPALLRPAGLAQTLQELRTRFEKLYAGTPEQRAIQVRIVLDALPGVAAPLSLTGPTS